MGLERRLFIRELSDQLGDESIGTSGPTLEVLPHHREHEASVCLALSTIEHPSVWS